MDDNDPINKPFSELSRFLKEHRIKVKKEPTASRTKEAAPAPQEEERLLSEAMEGVRTIRRGERKIRAKKHAPVMAPSRENEEERLLREVLADHSVINVTNLPEYMEGCVEGINPLIMEKLRKGEFSVQQVIDLHGLSIESARETFEYFLSDAVRKGLRCVKVIHGRGLRSKRDPIIKDYLKTWIVRAMHRKWVTAFSNATMAEGGPGATCILLRSKPEKKRIHIIG
ncbi:MAG: Smr/MutS family protein [Syntrophorhabdaceae bacterium]|nr:Smr/MutS family protein [Syntrophorhabdaceae bacterium]